MGSTGRHPADHTRNYGDPFTFAEDDNAETHSNWTPALPLLQPQANYWPQPSGMSLSDQSPFETHPNNQGTYPVPNHPDPGMSLCHLMGQVESICALVIDSMGSTRQTPHYTRPPLYGDLFTFAQAENAQTHYRDSSVYPSSQAFIRQETTLPEHPQASYGMTHQGYLPPSQTSRDDKPPWAGDTKDFWSGPSG